MAWQSEAGRFQGPASANSLDVQLCDLLAIGAHIPYPSKEWVDQVTLAAEQTVNRICEREKLRVPVLGETLVRMGTPSEIINETAGDRKTDLIILATHGRTGLAHVLHGSTAEKVIRQAPCPVLVVRVR
jgi:nucleotide-binding universal stress UspA family protein